MQQVFHPAGSNRFTLRKKMRKKFGKFENFEPGENDREIMIEKLGENDRKLEKKIRKFEINFMSKRKL